MGAQVARSVTQSHPVHCRPPGLWRDDRAGASERIGIDPYLVTRLLGQVDERLLCLFYDGDGTFTAEWTLTGSLSSVQARRTELARAAMGSNAHYAVMAHNHPSGVPGPSLLDITSTRRVYRLFAALGVTLVDHVIVGSDGLAFSFRLAGLI